MAFAPSLNTTVEFAAKVTELVIPTFHKPDWLAPNSVLVIEPMALEPVGNEPEIPNSVLVMEPIALEPVGNEPEIPNSVLVIEPIAFAPVGNDPEIPNSVLVIEPMALEPAARLTAPSTTLTFNAPVRSACNGLVLPSAKDCVVELATASEIDVIVPLNVADTGNGLEGVTPVKIPPAFA